MSTNISTYDRPRTNDKARALFTGYRGEGPTGDVIRSMVRKGFTVVREQSPRWEENRGFYSGNQWTIPGPGAQQLRYQLTTPTGRPGYNAYNQLRKNVDARVALLTKERPPYEVIPEDNDQDSIEAARMAEKFIAARWGQEGWKVDESLVSLCKNGDVDGLSWLCVEWDPNASSSVDQALSVHLDGSPITDRDEYEALKVEDPEAKSLWRIIRSNRPLGDVSWRVVLPAALSLDPFAVNNYSDANWICEMRVRPRAEVEKRMGKSFKELVKQSREMSNPSNPNTGNVNYEDLSVAGGERTDVMNERDAVLVHYFYARPCTDFPQGARIELLDRAPAMPLLAEEYQDELPYFPFIPRPDQGHLLRSKGMVDDLKPVQRSLNLTHRYLDTWLFKLAMSPVYLPIGALRGQDFFNEAGYLEINMGVGEPRQSQIPAEPTSVFANHLMSLRQEMEDLSGVSAIARGFTTPGGPEAASAFSQQIQQTEHNLSEVEKRLKAAIEWGGGRSLRLVEKHYTRARAVGGVGVDDAGELQAFAGAMVRGANRLRVTGPLMPKSKAARMAQINNMAPTFGPELQPYLVDLIDGDTTRLMRDRDRERAHQRDEQRKMLSLVTNEKAKLVFKRFEEDKVAFSKAFNAAQAIAAQQPPSIDPTTGESGGPVDPMEVLGSEGIVPPNLTRSMQQAGIPVPLVEPEDEDNGIQLDEMKTFRLDAKYDRTDPLFQQLFIEHRNDHKAGLRAQMQAMAAQSPMGEQQGSQAAEKGTPSPPKNEPKGGPPQ